VQEQGFDQPAQKDRRQATEEQAAAMEGQLVLLNVLQDGCANWRLTGTLHYLLPEQCKVVRCPLLLEVEGFSPAYMPVGKAQPQSTAGHPHPHQHQASPLPCMQASRCMSPWPLWL
jgi:hypothetical protein